MWSNTWFVNQSCRAYINCSMPEILKRVIFCKMCANIHFKCLLSLKYLNLWSHVWSLIFVRNLKNMVYYTLRMFGCVINLQMLQGERGGTYPPSFLSKHYIHSITVYEVLSVMCRVPIYCCSLFLALTPLDLPQCYPTRDHVRSKLYFIVCILIIIVTQHL